jgi:hypothetical protein
MIKIINWSNGIPLASCAPITEDYWYTVHERSHSERAVETPIGAQGTIQSSEDWHSGYQDSGNELSIYIALIAGYQIGIRQGARSI